jgi:hypothetical protein
MLAARCAATLGLLALLEGGCDVTQSCCGTCPESLPAVFNLSCDATDLTSVVATGPCAMDASLSSYLGNGAVFVRSEDPGTCHVTLTFATGFAYSADVTFASQPGGVCGGPQCKCGDYVAPTSGPFSVSNPSSTCVDAGQEGGVDAGSAVCPSEATEYAPCAALGTCTGCRDRAEFECTCEGADASGVDGGGLQWECIDTYLPCSDAGP